MIAEVLAGGKTSRLYRSLVHEKHMALDVTALQQSRELDGMFQVIVTATPGVTLDTIAAAIDAELAKLMDHGPTADEMSRSLAQAEAQFIYRLQTVGGFNGKSDQLNAYNVYIADPGYFEADLERYRRLSIEDVRAAARRLAPAQRVALSVVPVGQAVAGAGRFHHGGGELMPPIAASSRRSDPIPAFIFRASPNTATTTPRCGCGRSNTASCRSSASCCCCRSASPPIRPIVPASPRSPPTCSTKAAARPTPSPSTSASRASAASSTPKSARMRRWSA